VKRLLRALFAAAPLFWCAAPAVAQHEPAPGAAAPSSPAPAPAKKSSCIECHERQQGVLQAPVAALAASVHGKAGIGCEGCHGGDLNDPTLAHSPSASFLGRPRLREVPYVCGNCHADIRDKHLGSVHGKNGLPHCVTCHGGHDVAHPDPAQIITEGACGKCHPFKPAQTAQSMLQKARELIVELGAFAKGLEHTPGVDAALQKMQTDLHLDRKGVIATFHSFRIGDIAAIGGNVDRVKKTLARLRDREELREENYSRERPMILLLMGFLVLAAAFGYFVYHGRGEVHADKTAADPNHADAGAAGAPHDHG